MKRFFMTAIALFSLVAALATPADSNFGVGAQYDTTHVYVCGLRGMEQGVEESFRAICGEHGLDWSAIRAGMRETGRYHVETY